jgi:Lar family restriction alleviation protein
MEKLKPCPFCGGEAVMQAPNMHHVTCIACRDCMVSSKWGKPEDVVAMWNKRVEPKEPELPWPYSVFWRYV